MFTVVLQRDAALGNGTRLRGQVLGTVSGVEPSELVELAQATPGKTLRDLALPEGSVSLAEGVEACELLTAVRNGDLVAYADASERADFAEIDEDPEDDFPEAGNPAVAPTATKAKAPRAKKAQKTNSSKHNDDPTAGRR